VVRGRGFRVERRVSRFAASCARNMRAAGWPWHRVRASLRVSQRRAEQLATIWGRFKEELRRAA
jgi:hypothetical protein